MIFMVGAGLFQPLLCKDKGSLVNIQRTFINLINFISLRLGSIADNHLIEKDTAVLNAESNLKAVDTEFLG